MASLRTQIYLTARQRERLDEVGARDGKSLAELIREAVDHFLERDLADVHEALEATFGTIPDLEAPSRDDWDRGYS